MITGYIDVVVTFTARSRILTKRMNCELVNSQERARRLIGLPSAYLLATALV